MRGGHGEAESNTEQHSLPPKERQDERRCDSDSEPVSACGPGLRQERGNRHGGERNRGGMMQHGETVEEQRRPERTRPQRPHPCTTVEHAGSKRHQQRRSERGREGYDNGLPTCCVAGHGRDGDRRHGMLREGRVAIAVDGRRLDGSRCALWVDVAERAIEEPAPRLDRVGLQANRPLVGGPHLRWLHESESRQQHDHDKCCVNPQGRGLEGMHEPTRRAFAGLGCRCHV